MNAAPLDPIRCLDLVNSDKWRISESPDGCHAWLGQIDQDGYGRVFFDKPARLAHRIALVSRLGRDITTGMEAGHLCHDEALAAGECDKPCMHRRCVNPDHLIEQSHRDNSLAGNTVGAINAAKTHCPKGHAYTAENTYSRPRKSGPERYCRSCREGDPAHAMRCAARDAVRRAAAKSLRIGSNEYRSVFGSSYFTAGSILAAVESGIAPEVIVANARTAHAAIRVENVDAWLATLRPAGQLTLEASA